MSLRHVLKVAILVGVGLFTISPDVQSQVPDLLQSPGERVDSAMSLLLGATVEGPRKATEMLVRLPSDLVAPRIVEALQNPFDFPEPAVRRLALTVLAVHQAYPHPDTYELLVAGLADPEIADVCTNALRATPLERRGDVALRLGRSLLALHRSDPEASGRIVQIAVEYGADAWPTLPALERTLHDTLTASPRVRIAAGLAVAEVGDAKSVMTAYRNLDAIGTQGALVGLSHLALKTNRDFGRDSLVQQEAWTLARSALLNANPEVVKYALDALPSIYGTQLYVTSPDGTLLRPDVKEILLTAAREAENPELRSILVAGLQRLDHRASQQD